MNEHRNRIVGWETPKVLESDKKDARSDAVMTSVASGCLAYLGLALIGGVAVSLGEIGRFDLGQVLRPLVALALLAGLTAYPVAYKKYVADKEREKYEAKKRKAEEAGNSLIRHRAKAESLLRGLGKRLNNAVQAIEAARGYFNERAYAPFWDSVERAAIQLAKFNADVREIRSLQEREANELEAWQGCHTFDEFPVRRRSIPNPERVIRQLNDTVRKGQKDFEFATIWEQRSTRKVLVSGFETLGQAVGDMEATIAMSLEELK